MRNLADDVVDIDLAGIAQIRRHNELLVGLVDLGESDSGLTHTLFAFDMPDDGVIIDTISLEIVNRPEGVRGEEDTHGIPFLVIPPIGGCDDALFTTWRRLSFNVSFKHTLLTEVL